MRRDSEGSHADEALTERLHRGDPAAFAVLTSRYWNAIHRIAWNMLSSASEAAQVAEETFLLALRSRESFPSGVPFKTSLYRVAIELSLTRCQPRPRSIPDSLDALVPERDAKGSLAQRGEDWSELPEPPRQRRQLADRIREALGWIDGVDRASFVLREIEQLPLEEAAKILRTSPERIRERAHRGYLMLSGSLGHLFFSSPGRRAMSI